MYKRREHTAHTAFFYPAMRESRETLRANKDPNEPLTEMPDGAALQPLQAPQETLPEGSHAGNTLER